ncbi:MAG: hypothetical protein R3A46_17695 [Thermomicrobiales bacterium]
MTREFLRYPIRAMIYGLAIIGTIALLLELVVESSTLFFVGSALIGVSFVGWGIAYLMGLEWVGPAEARRERPWLGFLFIGMGAFTLVVLLIRLVSG